MTNDLPVDLMPVAAPEPGIHEGVPHAVYLQWDAISNGGLTDIKRSPKRYRWVRDHPEPPTEAQVIGTAVHMCVLEPDRFAKTYALRPPGDGRTKAVREARAALEMSGRILLKPEQWDMIHAMRDSVEEHPEARGFIHASGNQLETSITWDRVTRSGVTVRCKIRPDIIDAVVLVIGDFKSAINAHPGAFPDVIYRRGYHRGAAFYLEGATAVGIACEHYLYIAIEKTPPYEVAMYDLEQSAIEAGKDEIEDLLDVYGRCLLKDHWPSYPTGVHRIGLPNYAYSRIRNGVEKPFVEEEEEE